MSTLADAMLNARQKFELKKVNAGLEGIDLQEQMVSFELGQLDTIEDSMTKRKLDNTKYAKGDKSSKRRKVDSSEAPQASPSLVQSALTTGAVFGMGTFALELVAYRQGRITMTRALRNSVRAAAHGTTTHVATHYMGTASNAIFGSAAPNVAQLGFWLVAADLTKEGMSAIDDWISGNITGIECAKKLGVSISTAAVTSLSIDAGTRIGQYFLGSVGAVVGGVCGYLLGSKLCDVFARWLFGVDTPEDALAAAYQFLGVTPESTDREVRIAYLRRAVELHPDRNNNSRESNENMIRLNTAYHLIRESRRREERSE